jgi:polysaccharide pyruvyl transferase WcaK-like protein
MKIGILTYHAAFNFGANLQALSTFSYLKYEGHDPIIIDFSPKELEEAFDKSVPMVQANAHKKYLQTNFVMTSRCRNAFEVAQEIDRNDIEAVIIGSDAVVQHYSKLARIHVNPSKKTLISVHVEPVKYETNFPNPFWGEFVQYVHRKIKIAMMSVSCQNTDYRLINRQERGAIYKMVERFHYISVRDQRTRSLFKHISGGRINPSITPDPVFAFNNNVRSIPTRDEILRKYNLPDKYILLSFNSSKTVSKNWVTTFEQLASEKDLSCVAFAMPGGIKFSNDLKYKINVPLDPIDWYCLIKYSSGYVGEKMHPIIVSLHNCVPFFCFDHYGILRAKIFLNQKASKIYHILDKANMLDYRIQIARRLTYKEPAPGRILSKIVNFDRQACSEFSTRMLYQYKTMMKTMLRALE